LHAAKHLLQGGLIAHRTSTVFGIAANPKSRHAIHNLQHFKQRHGPFLLLADSVSTALKQARYITPTLRHMAKQHWPGAVTLIFPARKRLSSACYQHGNIAVRVDADPESRRLAHVIGGLLLSSSFNRRGKPIMPLTRPVQHRFSRHLATILEKKTGRKSDHTPQQVSKIFSLQRNSIKRLR